MSNDIERAIISGATLGFLSAAAHSENFYMVKYFILNVFKLIDCSKDYCLAETLRIVPSV